MGKFRYTGMTLQGGSNGEMPEIVKQTEMRCQDGTVYTFTEKRYTEVPEDQVFYSAQVLNRKTRSLEWADVLLCEKLRNNGEMEEQERENAA